MSIAVGKSRKEEVQEYKLAGRNSTNWQTGLLKNQNWENSLQKCALFLFIAQVPSSPMWKSVVSLCLVGFFLSSYVQFYQRWYKHNRKLGPAAEWPCALSLVVAVLVSQHIQILLKGWKLVLGSIPWEKDLKRWFGTCQNWRSSARAKVKQHMCEEAGKGCLWESARRWLSAVRQSLDPPGLNGHRVTTSSREETPPPHLFSGALSQQERSEGLMEMCLDDHRMKSHKASGRLVAGNEKLCRSCANPGHFCCFVVVGCIRILPAFGHRRVEGWFMPKTWSGFELKI